MREKGSYVERHRMTVTSSPYPSRGRSGEERERRKYERRRGREGKGKKRDERGRKTEGERGGGARTFRGRGH